jgi:cation diffusion facilitator family transporter
MINEKQRVALISILASTVLAGSKLVAAIFTGSLGILSEAVHSIIDMGATVITWVAVRYSDQPPDEDHHFGHEKVESISALIATGLLFLTTAWVAWEAIHRLLSGHAEVEVTWWAAAIIAGTVLIDLNRSRALMKVARKTSSAALEADALHFTSDMWSSLVVLAGLGAVWLGYSWADPLAALIISVFIARAGWQLGKRTLDTLLDAAPQGALEKITELARQTEGVMGLTRCRVRPAGATLFIDVDISVRRILPLEEVSDIKLKFADTIRSHYPNGDISVTANGVAIDDETLFDKVLLQARRRGLAIHHLTAQHVDGRTALSFDLEVDGEMSLAEAHEVATGLERAIHEELGGDIEIDSHIEPLHPSGISGTDADAKSAERVETQLRKLAISRKPLTDVHKVRVRATEHGLFVSYHCRFPGSHSVEAVHEAVDALEEALRKKLPEVRRVIAHAEPIGRAPH